MKNREHLIEICKQFNIGLCYIFGSMVDIGEKLIEDVHVSLINPETDIDIGTVFVTFPVKDKRRIYGTLYDEISSLFYPYRLDLVFLQETNPLLQFEAINGVNLFQISDVFRDSYEEMVMRFAADLRYFDKLYEHDFLGAIKDGYFEFKYDANYR